MSTVRRRFIAVIGVAVSLLFLWLALRDTNFAAVGHALNGADLWVSLPFLAVLGLFFWVRAVRWRILLLPLCRTTTREVFPAAMMGYVGNMILPAQLGELLRMFLLARRLQLSNTPVLATIALERLFDLLAVFVLLVVAIGVGTRVPPALVAIGHYAIPAGILVLAATIAYIGWTPGFVALFRKLTGFLPKNLQGRLVGQLEILAQGLSAIKQPRLLIGIAAISLFLWALMGMCAYLSLIALDIDAPLSAGYVILALTVVGMTLPSAPGFLGIIQLSFTTALAPYGVIAAEAFAASVFYHVLMYVAVTLAGIFYIRHIGDALFEMKQDAAAGEKPR